VKKGKEKANDLLEKLYFRTVGNFQGLFFICLGASVRVSDVLLVVSSVVCGVGTMYSASLFCYAGY